MENITDIQDVQSQEPTQQDPPIKKLWSGLVNDGKYTKSFDDFAKQYNTPESISKLYKGLTEDGDYTKSIDDFKSQYFSDLKKKVGGAVIGANSGATPSNLETPSQLPETNNSGNKLGVMGDIFSDLQKGAKAMSIQESGNVKEDNTQQPNKRVTTLSELMPMVNPDLLQQPKAQAVSTLVRMNPPTDAIAKKKLELDRTRREQLMQDAVINTAENALRLKGINAPKGSPLWNEEVDKKKLAVLSGNATYHMDLKTGKPMLDKTANWWDDIGRGWNKAVEDEDEASNFINGMNTAQRAAYANERATKVQPDNPGEYLSVRHGVGELIGGAAPFMGKAIAGGVAGAGLAALAPETGGATLAGLPAVMSFAFTAPSAIRGGMRDETLNRYYQLKRENPNMSDVNAMSKAEEGMISGGISSGLLNAALSDVGGGALTKAVSSEGKNVLKDFIGGTLKAGHKLGTATALATTGQSIETALEGYKTTPTDVIKKSIESYVDGAKTGMVLHSFMTGISVLPKAVNSALKYVLATEVPKSEIVNTLDANVKVGNITPEVADKTINDIDNFKASLEKTNPNLSPESKVSVAGLMQSRDNLVAEMEKLDKTQQAPYQTKIDAINNQIQKITETNKPLDYELDDVTGEPLSNRAEKVKGEITIPIKVDGNEMDVKYIDEYKGKKIVEVDGNIHIYDPKQETLFNVALDDSNGNGRIINQDANNIESAKKYIDWADKTRKENTPSTTINIIPKEELPIEKTNTGTGTIPNQKQQSGKDVVVDEGVGGNSDFIEIHHGSGKGFKLKNTSIYLTEDKTEAALYAKNHSGKVYSYLLDKGKIADEDYVRDAIDEMGLKDNNGNIIDSNEYLLHELLDQRFDETAINVDDINKLYKKLKDDGYSAIDFADEGIGKKKNTTSILVFDTQSLKNLKEKLSTNPEIKINEELPDTKVQQDVVGSVGVGGDVVKEPMSDNELQQLVGRDVFKQIQRSEEQLGEGVVDRNRMIETAKRIQTADKKDKLLPEHIFEALQYEIGFPDNWQDLRNAIKKGGIDINSEAIQRQIEVGVDLPKDIVEEFKKSERYKKATPELKKAVEQSLSTQKSKLLDEGVVDKTEPNQKINETQDQVTQDTNTETITLDNNGKTEPIKLTEEELAKRNEIKNAIIKAGENKKSIKGKNDAMVEESDKYGEVGKQILKDINGESNPNSELTGVTHAETDAISEELGLPTYEKDPQTREKWDSEANDRLKNDPKAISKLLTKLNNGEHPDAVEQRIMAKYLASLKARININPTNELISEYKTAKELSDVVGGREVAKSLVARKELVPVEDNLADYMIREMEVEGVNELTDNQKEKVKTEFNNIQKANEDLNSKIKELEEKNAKLEAEKKIKSTTKKKTGERKTSEDYAKERESIVNQINEKIRLAREKANDPNSPTTKGIGGRTYLDDLHLIVPDVAKLVKSYVEEGVSKLEDIVKAVHEKIKEIIPEITEKDIHDIIAGKYNPQAKTKDEISKKVEDLKLQAKLINKLESLENGVEPTNERKKIERNQEIKKLREQIKDYEEKNPNSKNLNELKSKIQNEIKNLENDLATGNIAPKERKVPTMENKELKKKYPQLYKDIIESKDKLIKLKQERRIRLLQQQYENRTKWQKFKDGSVEVLNMPRSIMSSMDFSAPLRQGLIPTIAHPTVAASAAVEMFKQSVSQKRFDRWFHDLRETPQFTIMDKSGLYIADPHDIRLSVKEEAFMNNLAEKIPLVGRFIKGSERAYVCYLNKMRVDLFSRGADLLESQGKTLENSKREYESLASWVNNSTGRGKMADKLENAAPLLNGLLFSPRLIAARINTINPMYYANMPKSIRIKALGDMAKFVGFGMTVLALAKLNGAQVETDPRSSDFGKIKVGDTRYDIWGGFSQYIRFFTQIVSGQRKSSNTGNIQELDGKGAFGTSRGDVLTSFVRGKLAPIPSMGYDFISGRTTTGDRASLSAEAENHLLPLIYSDVKDAFKEQGVKSLFTVGLPAAFGVGVQTYTPNQKTSKSGFGKSFSKKQN